MAYYSLQLLRLVNCKIQQKDANDTILLKFEIQYID